MRMRARGKESRTYVYVRIIIIVWNSTLRNLDSCLVHLNAILFYLECDLSISEYTKFRTSYTLLHLLLKDIAEQ